MQTPRHYGSTATQAAHAHQAEAQSEFPPARSGRVAIDYANKILRALPAQLKANPAALLGIGIGVGVAIGMLALPIGQLFVPRKRGFEAFRERVARALDI